MSRVFNLILVVAVVFVGLAFHIKNDAPITLNYYLGAVELPLSWVVVAALLVGVLLGAVVASFPLERRFGAGGAKLQAHHYADLAAALEAAPR